MLQDSPQQGNDDDLGAVWCCGEREREHATMFFFISFSSSVSTCYLHVFEVFILLTFMAVLGTFNQSIELYKNGNTAIE